MKRAFRASGWLCAAVGLLLLAPRSTAWAQRSPSASGPVQDKRAAARGFIERASFPPSRSLLHALDTPGNRLRLKVKGPPGDRRVVGFDLKTPGSRFSVTARTRHGVERVKAVERFKNAALQQVYVTGWNRYDKRENQAGVLTSIVGSKPSRRVSMQPIPYKWGK